MFYEQIWNIHNMFIDIEDAFRCVKSELGLRPIYHRKEEMDISLLPFLPTTSYTSSG